MYMYEIQRGEEWSKGVESRCMFNISQTLGAVLSQLSAPFADRNVFNSQSESDSVCKVFPQFQCQ